MFWASSFLWRLSHRPLDTTITITSKKVERTTTCLFICSHVSYCTIEWTNEIHACICISSIAECIISHNAHSTCIYNQLLARAAFVSPWHDFKCRWRLSSAGMFVKFVVSSCSPAAPLMCTRAWDVHLAHGGVNLIRRIAIGYSVSGNLRSIGWYI